MWSGSSARRKLSTLLDRAERDAPQRVGRRTRRFVVLTAAGYERLTGRRVEDLGKPKPKMTLAEFLLNGPSFEGVDLERDRSPPRDIDLSGSGAD